MLFIKDSEKPHQSSSEQRSPYVLLKGSKEEHALSSLFFHRSYCDLASECEKKGCEIFLLFWWLLSLLITLLNTV